MTHDMNLPAITQQPKPFLERVRGWLRAITPRRWRRGVAVVPVVRLAGVIGFSTPLRPGLTLFAIARTLDKAFKQKGIKAIALVINSPGGSAVQSHLIYQRIRQMAAEKKVPVIAFVEDVAASGGYMIACAAEEIVADASSIVGSIGVVGASFGFDEAIKRAFMSRSDFQAALANVRAAEYSRRAATAGRYPTLSFGGNYGDAGQLGLESSLGEYVAVMVDAFREVRRVLRKDGTLWLNYGDSYATSPNGSLERQCSPIG